MKVVGEKIELKWKHLGPDRENRETNVYYLEESLKSITFKVLLRSVWSNIEASVIFSKSFRTKKILYNG